MMILPMASFRSNLKPAIRFQHRNEFLNLHLAKSTALIYAPHNVAIEPRR